MKAKFSHVNLISKDWRSLADFYITVFGCKEKPPERDLRGPWVDTLTNLEHAHIKGSHLLLPGYGEDGPTLEIFTYDTNREHGQKRINSEGLGHIAFSVEDVQACVDQIISHGGSLVGDIVDADIAGVGRISVAYATDPEGNIIEIQRWS